MWHYRFGLDVPRLGGGTQVGSSHCDGLQKEPMFLVLPAELVVVRHSRQTFLIVIESGQISCQDAVLYVA